MAGNNPLRDPNDLRLPKIAGPCALVLFGVTGDLATKKLLPAIYDLVNRGLLPAGFALIGFARREWDQEDFAKVVHDAVQEHCRTTFREETWEQLLSGIRFVQGSFDDDAAFDHLRETMEELDRDHGTAGNHAFYLSIPPSAFPTVIDQLKKHGLADQKPDSWRRVVIEKPFGHDLKSAQELDDAVSQAFDQEDVFRIDHYLGKETVQNLLALRFANTIFEPLWNSSFVDSVQITMAESVGIGGRAGYYDGVGAARDVIQNHLLQLMALVAMEEPSSFDAANLRTQKIKLLSAISGPTDIEHQTARGQYTGGWQGSEQVVGYTEEEGYSEESCTETYAAIRLEIANRRWAGVPFYLRTGKRLGRRVTEVAIIFKKAPFMPFTEKDTSNLGNNALIIRVQPDEGVSLRIGAKVPGTAMEIRDVTMDFGYTHAFTEHSPEAYERLILDVLLGDPPLFPSREEVNLSWKILDPIEEYWASHGRPEPYRAGTWGPASADAMLARDGRTWRRP
jgi:glucose-6-phosphate 1-dehydrogenase